MIKVVGLQIENQFDRDKNLDRAADWISKIRGDTDLVLLPELFTSGYSKEVFQNLSEVAENKTSDSFELFSLLARQYKTYISFGFPEKVLTNRFGPNGFGPVVDYYISQAVIDRNGETIGTYRKVHLAQFENAVEKDYFTAGHFPMTFEIDGVKIGIATCYDFRFPEYIRKLTLACEIDFLLHPSVFTRDDTWFSWHAFVQTRALENQIYILSLNYAGEDYGSSILVHPGMDSLDKCLQKNESSLRVIIDPDLIQEARERWPYREDRKLEF